MASQSNRSRSHSLGNLRDLLPQHKFDTDKLEHLSKMNPKEWESIAIEVLGWMADWAWPTTAHVVDLFVKHPEAAIKPIRTLFREWSDDEWQCNVVVGLIPALPRKYQYQLLDDLVYLRTTITDESEERYEWREIVDQSIYELDEYGDTLLREGRTH